MTEERSNTTGTIQEAIQEVHIDGLAVLKIVKHCQESLPNLVAGTLLGLDVNGTTLEITHAFPNPEPTKQSSANPSSEEDNNTTTAPSNVNGVDYSLEMLKMLREVNVDNNCVGFYQSISLGTFNTAKLVEELYTYQEASNTDVTDLQVAVLILFDPIQTQKGNLALKCLRLTQQAIDVLKHGNNGYLDPKMIFEELPVKIHHSSLVKALLHNVKTGQYYADVDDDGMGDGNGNGGNNKVAGGANGGGGGGNGGGNDHDLSNYNDSSPVYEADTTFDRLDLSTNPYLEKHLEFMCTWVDDLAAEQNKFQYYMRGLARNASSGNDRRKHNKGGERIDAKEAWASGDAPRRLESLLISNQIRTYCDQVDQFADGGLGKLFVVDGLHREEKKSS